MLDDQKNAGPSKIKDYVANRIMHAREDIIQTHEENLFAWNTAFVDQMNGLFDIVGTVTGSTTDAGCPTFAKGTPAAVSPTYNISTFGGISRSDYSWWRPKNVKGLNAEVNLRNDMNTLYNTVSQNLSAPNFIICDQDLYEYYQEESMDKLQHVRSAFNQTASDLGFESCTFKGKPMSWTSMLAGTDKLFMLNLDWIELVYDPSYFFDMTEWFTTSSQLERVAYILSAMQLIDSQPRRHGLLDYNTTTYA